MNTSSAFQPPAKLAKIGERGRVTLPAGVRRKYGLKPGDLVEVTETTEGILITPKAVIAKQLLDQLQQALGDTSLEDWIVSGKAVRDELLSEQYGLSKDSTN